MPAAGRGATYNTAEGTAARVHERAPPARGRRARARAHIPARMPEVHTSTILCICVRGRIHIAAHG